jgi:hypothetical protein
MSEISLEFGFHPGPIEIAVGEITIRSLPDREAITADLKDETGIEKDWIYAPAERSRDSATGVMHEKPYSARIFGLPKTHSIAHRCADDEDHLRFHLWSLSFFSGIRLTSTEAGFLDATPLKPGKLVDFLLLGDSLSASVELAERFWTANRATPRQARRLAAAVHALFLSQYPQALEFERFHYLYAALDACYALAREAQTPSKQPVSHARRAAWLCQRFGMDVPAWAEFGDAGSAEVAAIRNDAVHEALYMDEPLGFALHGVGTIGVPLALELQALVCRLIVALIGAESADYVRAPINTRMIQGLRLS